MRYTKRQYARPIAVSESLLSPIRVLDLTHGIAGPYATKLLGDHGAQVLKVERPGRGDWCRALGPFVGEAPHPEKSLPFLYLNTSKKGITVNLKSSTGKHILRDLLHWADLVVMNFAPRTLERLGLLPNALLAENPRLVVVSITNFGLEGPYRDYKAWDIVEYAMSGLMYIYGSYDREPLAHALYQAQYRAGTVAAGAALLALYGAEGTAQEVSPAPAHNHNVVDISIMECLAAALRDTITQYTYQGVVRRRGPLHGRGLGRPLATRDGFVVPVMPVGADWDAFAAFIGAPELKDGRFATAEGRILHAAELEAILARRFVEFTKLRLFHEAQSWRFVFGVVLTPWEVAENEQLHERGFFVDITHPVVGPLTLPGPFALFSEAPGRISRPAPTLGQHNEEVFCAMLGYSQHDLVRLRQGGII